MPSRLPNQPVNRRDFGKACFAGAAASSLSLGAASSLFGETKPAPAAQEKRGAGGFDLRGVYFHDGFTADPQRLAPLHWDEPQWRRQIKWLSACGVNAVEFSTMLEFNRLPSTDLERNKIADRLQVLDLAHELGLQFGYILSNTVVSTVPADQEPGDQSKNRAVQLCPRQGDNFQKTVDLQSWYMQTYKEADFFEEFAADWGACNCGECGVNDYMRYVEEFAHRLQKQNAAAPLYANTWSISYWGEDPIPKGWNNVFSKETPGSQAVVAALRGMPANVHLALPCHNLYRPLVFSSFGGKRQTPVFPTLADVQSILDSGRHVMGWPHFLMDDDTAREPQWGLVHVELRYIKAMLQSLRAAGLDRVMGNLYLPNLQLANTYGFGRLAQDPGADIADVQREFASNIVQREDVAALADVLSWLDNNSYWDQQMPPDAREAPLPCDLNRERVGSVLADLRPLSRPELPVPVDASQWLDDLRATIPRMTWAT
jgi:hypothetical protein